MIEKLTSVFKSFEELTEEDINKGIALFIHKSYKKGETIIEAGTTCDWIAFVCSGILRNYYISSKDEEVTYCMTFPNKFITAYSSFISGQKTFENIHALVDTEVLIIKKHHFLELTQSNHRWLNFAKFFAEQSYILMEHRLLSLQMESAEKRYNDLISTHPEYIQQVPLKYIASYLGITQRHLSRLRKNLL
ncbi:MAG: Crp/Fnr family transcriptional regulator [Cytophagales bacterium]|nr:Crp/Fnr family transcriptional regulator [Cytophagales bacterium]